MGKAYSEDLRLKALAALDGGMKKMAIHQSFGSASGTLSVSCQVDDAPTAVASSELGTRDDDAQALSTTFTAIPYSHTNSYSHSYTNANSYSHTNAHANSHTNGNTST